MTTIALPNDVIKAMRKRVKAGETLGLLAREAGLSWQKLWGFLYSSTPPRGPVLTVTGKGALTEKYRPTSLKAIWGQEAVVKWLKNFADFPYPTALLFEGETGTGKTSAAVALAGALGCDLSQKPPEFGGVHSVASGEQTADTVRETCRLMWNSPFSGSGWKVVIVNEADRMALPAETIWLDRLESLPQRTVVIFTTNNSERLSQRFKDRCTRLGFESDAAKLRPAAQRFVAAVWKAETGKKPDAAKIREVIDATECDGQLSFRRLVQETTVAIGREPAK
ncbi:MAG: AAA family ATPase [Acidobacteria bacterium]|nr:AAA family ATPase [Planctomycetota bacterium]MBE3133653.1 AAA family ATPase [Acidobacteriota bacterium]